MADDRRPGREGYEQSATAIERIPRKTAAKEMAVWLEGRTQNLARWVTGGLRPEALLRFFLQDYMREDDSGVKLRACSTESIYLALIACAVTGLEPGSLKQHAFVIPYGRVATYVAGYRGLIKQARQSREVRTIHSELVYERDEFSLDLGEQRVSHKPHLGDDRGRMIGGYAVARLTGGQEIEWMSAGDLEKVRKASRGGQAWRDWADQMYRKAALRRLCKRLPLGDQYVIASTLDVSADAGEGMTQGEILDLVTPEDGGPSATQSARDAEVSEDKDAKMMAHLAASVAQDRSKT